MSSSKLMDYVKLIGSVLIFLVLFDWVYSSGVDGPSDWDNYKDKTCYRCCYRGIYEEGLRQFNESGKSWNMRYELRDMEEYFEAQPWYEASEYECSEIRREEQSRIEQKIGSKERSEKYWDKVFG